MLLELAMLVLDLSAGSDTITAAPGTYGLQMFARWGGGDSALAFGLTVV